jgi:large subunit ribosomal protein L24
MKQEFSKSWAGSKQPRKQRKYRYNAPFHLRHKMLSANLSKELRKKYGKRNFPLKKNDEVRIMIGEFKNKKGKIEKVELKRLKVSVGGINKTKKDGSKVPVLFDPSNLQILELDLSDKERKGALERKKIEKKIKGENKSEEHKEKKYAHKTKKH